MQWPVGCDRVDERTVQLESVLQVCASRQLVDGIEIVVEDLVGDYEPDYVASLRAGGEHGEECGCLWIQPLYCQLLERHLTEDWVRDVESVALPAYKLTSYLGVDPQPVDNSHTNECNRVSWPCRES